jgi:GT2 family glycosyltransferase
MIEIVSATRLAEAEFWARSALGMSLRRLAGDKRLRHHISFENRRGLPEVYNARIAEEGGGDIAVFIHDDVWIDDYFFADHLIDALERFDVVGVGGCRNRVAGQPSWCFADERMVQSDPITLSGRVAHGKHPFGRIGYFGDVPAECELLDGVLLAARKSRLRAQSVAFDPAFDFHFYDLDFCRSARQRQLRLGTWRLCITHQSEGAFGSDAWTARYYQYIAKWGD